MTMSTKAASLRRFISLLSYQFKSYQPSVALNLLQKPRAVLESDEIDASVDSSCSKSYVIHIEFPSLCQKNTTKTLKCSVLRSVD